MSHVNHVNRRVDACRLNAANRARSCLADLLRETQGSSLLEFAITLPLLVVFVVGIYDFSGAFNQKQKIAQAAQEGAIIAGAQPMGDIQSTSASPASLLPVVTAVFNSLSAGGLLQGGATCTPPGAVTPPTAPPSLTWTYTIAGCSPGYTSDQLIITINRGCVCGSCGLGACASGPPYAVGTIVTVQFPYHWRFNSVIQLLLPGANYAAITQLVESATVHNQT
jgi:Tfp pilus assembly protein PilV